MIDVLFSNAENDILFFARQYMVSNLAQGKKYNIFIIEKDIHKENYLKDLYGRKIQVYDYFPKNNKKYDYIVNFSYDNYLEEPSYGKTFNFINKSSNCICPYDWSKDLFISIFSGFPEKELIKIFQEAYFNIFGIEAHKCVWTDLCHSSLMKRSRHALNGIAVRDDKMRMHIKEKFFNDDSKLWHIPIKKDVSKRFFEINACENVVTDDLFYVMASLILGKKVIFLHDNYSCCIKDVNVENIKVDFNE